MLAIKVPLKEAEKARRDIIQKNNLDTSYPLKKEKEYLLIPVKQKFVSKYEFVKKTLGKKEKNETFKDILKGKLTDREIKSLKTAYDHVGDIAIIEVDNSLQKKEMIIANALIKSNKTIKTVLKKGGIHEGEFRTQKMIYLAGENKKETIHRENNVRLKLDVEKVYFSPRLSTERKRIAELVKPNEEILVMFSGCAPYPCVLSKNTKAKSIIGIEMNPEGHKYGILNVKLNKLNNVKLFCGDVKIVVPWLKGKSVIGLKTHWRKEHLASRLKCNPALLEIYLANDDLEKRFDEVFSALREIRRKVKKIVIHTPILYNGIEVNICSKDSKVTKNTFECYTRLENLCEALDLYGFIAHPYSFDENSKIDDGISHKCIKKNLYSFLKRNRFGHMFLENIPWGVFSKEDEVIKIINDFKLKLCCDIVHANIAAGSEEEFYEAIKKYSEINPYFHIADTVHLGERRNLRLDHSSPIGEGNIDFTRVLPYIKEGIIEVRNKDEAKGAEIFASLNRINQIADNPKSFDRVLMPLPKSAEDFLETALSVGKKGTIIHFYDFLKEGEFFLAHEKIAKSCRKMNMRHKILRTVKCGQHAPHVFRICVDFQII